MQIRNIVAIGFLCLAFVAAGQAQPRFSSLPEGFRFDAVVSGSLPVSFEAGRDALPHWELSTRIGAEWAAKRWIPLRFEAGGFRVSPSRPDASLSLFKGFDGYRFALLTGPRFFPDASRRMEIAALGGAALSAARYTNTTLVIAYPSLLVEGRFLIAFPNSPYHGILGVPVELMFRGPVLTASAGVELAFGMSFGGMGNRR
ncbi:MAG: hypothetical protein JNG85_11565 [Spirochaetaceae bacterium]|nr:hypothetical protein [Spirochaetaceae bacterium]